MILLSIHAHIDIPSSPGAKVHAGIIVFQKVLRAKISLRTYIRHAELMLRDHGAYAHVSAHFAWELLLLEITLIFNIVLGRWRRGIANELALKLPHKYFSIDFSEFGGAKC